MSIPEVSSAQTSYPDVKSAKRRYSNTLELTGAKILTRVAGMDASKQFWKVGFVHRTQELLSQETNLNVVDIVSQRGCSQKVLTQAENRCDGGQGKIIRPLSPITTSTTY